MEEYFYEETKYIKRQDLKEYVELMLKYDFMPEYIKDEKEFNQVFQYLVNLTVKAPNFIVVYEYALSMLELLELNEELTELRNDLEKRKIEACEKIAEKEKLFTKTVEWGFHENRPLIRGLMCKADKLWEAGELKQANELFTKIYKTNEDDNVGARYSVKATGEGMSYQEFEERFTYTDERGTYYKNEELWDWFGEE